jgi:large subunit ribosomal protein L25
MDDRALSADTRLTRGNQVKAIRRQGIVPAVLYGSGIDGLAIQVDGKELETLLGRVGASSLITLKVEGEEHQVLVRDVQRDVIRRDLLHIDFLKVAMDVKIRTSVPVELINEAPAVKEHGGILVTGVTEIEVEALPGDLPDRIVVDLTPLAEIDDSVTVGELDLGEGVRVLTDLDENVAHVIFQAEEVEEEEEELEGLLELGAEPELVDQRGREEDDGEERRQDEEGEE